MRSHEYLNFECLDSPTLCPMDGRCPRCTARTLARSGDLARKYLADSRSRVFNTEATLNSIVKGILADPESDLSIAKKLRSAIRTLRNVGIPR